MKHISFPRAVAALPLAALLLCACTAAPLSPNTEGSSMSESDRAAYEARITELSETIISLKEKGYIVQAEYEVRIHAMESEIAALKAQLALSDIPDAGEDLPVGGRPDSPSETSPETSPSTDTPATMAFHYEIRNGRAVILSYQGTETCVSIPAVIEGYPVTAIEEAAFRATRITSVIIPDSVTEIGWFAFAECKTLQTVTVPASVEIIGYGAFDGCDTVTLYCPADSYAAKYAASFGLRHKYV